ncbi:MAG: hypothetical protein LQ342_003943 [Letrouitia transgressa]|nr:MAG: hypothetical protein LQ342_003943 [Letrouitia transgressa]
MGQQYIAFGAVDGMDVGAYYRQTRADCVQLIQPKNNLERTANVTACILDKFTEFDKALFASRQYILTLWPAFVGAIVALAPDPANMIYDNIWWSALFCITCGGLPGLETSSSPPHHIEAPSDTEGRTTCETWQYDISRPKKMSKSHTMGFAARGVGYIWMEWISFFLSLTLWLAFIVYFGYTLKPALNFSFLRYLEGAVWYYISASPAVLAAIFELLQNRVDLYEPIKGSDTTEERPIEEKASAATIMDVAGRASQSQQQQYYKRVEGSSVLALWPRILMHQWRRDKYRILVRDRTKHRYAWLFVIGRAMVGIGRVTVFALGSVTMGNILLMPVPDDLYLFVLLLFTTAVPRQLWPAFWTNGNRGADLVVFVNDVKLAGASLVG